MVVNGLIFGLISTLHCLGMCGPLVFAVPPKVKSNRFLFAFLYQVGRISVYTLIGVSVFLIGYSFSLFHMQQTLTIVLGVLLLLYATVSLISTKNALFLGFYSKYIGQYFNKVWNLPVYVSAFLLGVLNGLLPCGAIYLAAIYCASLQSVSESVMYMVLFGIGTSPIFIAAWLLFRKTQQIKWRKLLILYKLLPFIIGIIMILRGANLGIPYLSPELEKVNGQTEVKNCCQPKKVK